MSHGLADDCERCAEHAQDPFCSLDDAHLASLLIRTIEWSADRQFPRSDTELTAMKNAEAGLHAAWRIHILVDMSIVQEELIARIARRN